MASGRRRAREEPSEGRKRLLRVEEEALLSEALGDLMEKQESRTESGSQGGEEEEAPVEPETTSEELDPTDSAEAIPESAWEQKLAWANEVREEGGREVALDLYRELVEEEPADVRGLNSLGSLLGEMGEYDEAVVYLKRAQTVDPHSPEVAMNLGAAFEAMGRFGEAEEELRKALRWHPKNTALRGKLGVLLFHRGLYRNAAEELASVCASDPGEGVAFFYRGEALNRMGLVEEAIEALQRALELSPEEPRVYYQLGILYDKKGLREEAAQMYRRSRELS